MDEPMEGSYGAFVAAMADVKAATERLNKAAGAYLKEIGPELRAITDEQKTQILEGLRDALRHPRQADER